MEYLLAAFLLGVVGVSIATWVGCAAWVYRDARRRKLENATLWGAGTLLTGYFGLIAYIFVQGSSRSAALSGSTE